MSTKSLALEFLHTKLRLFSYLKKDNNIEGNKSWNKSINSNKSFLMHSVKKKDSFYSGVNKVSFPVYSNLQDGW